MILNIPKQSFSTSESRKDFAQRIRGIIDAPRLNDTFEVYHPNSDDYYWRVSDSNDWGLVFLVGENPEKQGYFRLWYRYQRGHDKESKIASWICEKFGAEIVPEPFCQ